MGDIQRKNSLNITQDGDSVEQGFQKIDDEIDANIIPQLNKSRVRYRGAVEPTGQDVSIGSWWDDTASGYRKECTSLGPPVTWKIIARLDDKIMADKLPYATVDTVGAVKPGAGLSIDDNGLLTTAGGAGAMGLTGYVASGMKFTVDSTLTLTVSAGRCSIQETAQELVNPTTIDLFARRAQLVYAQKGAGTLPTLGKIAAAFPSADAGTVCRWIIDGSANVANTVGSNDLVRNGTVTTEVGWAADYAGKGDGATGFYVSSNTAGFPTGAAARTIHFFWFEKTSGSRKFLWQTGYNVPFALESSASNTLSLSINGVNYSTGYALEEGKPYYAAITYDGTTVSVYVNGALVYALVIALTTDGPAYFRVGYYYTGVANYFSPATWGFAMLDNVCRTAAEIAAFSNAMLLPCRYYTSETANTYTDIRAILPADAISLGIVRTDATHPTEANDTDYKYGRREGAVSGNRRVFLGWKYFSGAVTLTWPNPFDTRKVRTWFSYAENASGKNECKAESYYYNGTHYGLVTVSASMSSSVFISVNTLGGGVVNLNGAYKTSGYIGCYAEVIE